MKHQRMNIPKIDISGVDHNEFPKTLLEKFYHAYNTYGFGYIVNHEIEKDLIDQLFQAIDLVQINIHQEFELYLPASS